MYRIAQSRRGPTWSNSGSMVGSTVSRAEPPVLHIGGNTADARRIREALTESSSERYDVKWVCRLSDGLEQLTTNRMSAVLLDLQLSDCAGIDALQKLVRAAPATPILVVGTDDDREI